MAAAFPWNCFQARFQICLILLAPLFEVIGGGPAIIAAVIHVLAAAVTADEERTASFFVIRAVSIVAAILAQLISSFILAPEETPILDPRRQCEGGMGSLDQDNIPLVQKHTSIRSRLILVSKQLHEGGQRCLWELVAHRLTGVVVLAPAGGKFASYGSAVLHLEKANFLWALGEGDQFVFFIILLPQISRMVLVRSQMNAYTAYSTISTASATMLSLGTFLLGLGVSIPVTIIGVVLMSTAGGLQSAQLSLVTTMISPDDISVVYSIFTILHVLSTSLTGPYLFRRLRFGIEVQD
ncbi:hypothetical protein BBP40_002694 [Aspergillus hancockii]|nr:hypothetical protein BBP40_002694 [Aspergillus hancockii]